jgi:hypothetical protein
MKTIKRRFIVVLSLSSSAPALSTAGHSIVTQMTGNPHFTNPNPSLASVAGLLGQLDVAQTATKTRTSGTVPVRDEAKVAVKGALHALKSYVQQIADANPDQAESIIASAGMGVKKSPTRTKVGFTAKAGAVSGAVHLVAKAEASRASYEWQWSGDGGKTWTTVPVTIQARTTITGLPVATSCLFRYRPVTKRGEGDWSQVVTLLVK